MQNNPIPAESLDDYQGGTVISDYSQTTSDLNYPINSNPIPSQDCENFTDQLINNNISNDVQNRTLGNQ
jgi:hypothetical protein